MNCNWYFITLPVRLNTHYGDKVPYCPTFIFDMCSACCGGMVLYWLAFTLDISQAHCGGKVAILTSLHSTHVPCTLYKEDAILTSLTKLHNTHVFSTIWKKRGVLISLHSRYDPCTPLMNGVILTTFHTFQMFPHYTDNMKGFSKYFFHLISDSD